MLKQEDSQGKSERARGGTVRSTAAASARERVVQAMGLKFEPVNDRDGCQFKAVVWRHAATSTAPITATTATTTATTATTTAPTTAPTTATTATTTAPADEDVRARILEAVRRAPRITAEAIAEDLGGISVDGVRYHLNALKRLKGLRYEGNPMKGGHWVVP